MVVMRVAMIFQWLRAASQDAARRSACLTYAVAISVAQLGWLAPAHGPPAARADLRAHRPARPGLVEISGPYVAERRFGGTPWHPHHIAERYGLFAIIALGEGLVGTVAAVSAVIEAQGWSLNATLVCIAGTGLTFGMWWVYFIVPSGPILHAHRERSFVWGYSQMAIFAAIVATGAGLHVAAYYIEHEAHIGPVATVLTVAIPVSVYLACIYALYTYLVRRIDPFHYGLLLGTAAVVALCVAAALAGLDMAACLIILMFAPMVTVVGYEMRGHRHQAEALVADGDVADD